MKKKIEYRSKSFIAMLMSLLIILSAFPITAFANEYITDMDSDAIFDVISGSLDKVDHELHYAKYDGKTYITFCCQFGVKSPDGSTYKYGKEFKKYLNRSGATYENIAKYIAFGYTLQHGDGLPSSKEEWIDACCTQQYVWEKLGVNPPRSSWNSTYMSNDLYKKWLSDTDDLIDEYYNTNPSFDNTTKKINIGESVTLTDSNGVFKYYPSFEKNINKVTFSHIKGKNTLVVSVASDCTTHSVKYNSAAEKVYMGLPTGQSYNANTMNYCYFEFEDGNVQDLMFSNYVDPQTFKIDVEIEFGSLKLIKTSEDGKVDNIPFTITGNGIDKTVKTNSKGEFQIDGLKPGKYTVTEITDDKYVEPESKIATVENGKTEYVAFNNRLKKFNITVTKSDNETKMKPQGDATLAGAVYGVYDNGELVDKYTTDTDGSFTTKDYICGDNWTVKEISPSTGYLLDDTEYPVNASAKNFKIEYNPIAIGVGEDVKKGRLAIIKHNDDGSTQIETPEAGAEFQVYLKSAGSYENANPDERDILVCDENGYAITKELPYGTYVIHQTKGWEGNELLPDFERFISENEKTYRVIANNAKFDSYLKIVKTDAETGKQIAYAGAGFQIYDPDGKLVKQTFTYQTPTTIDTFYTNSEGYLVTPEKLIYGKGYKLVEVKAPYGYVLDSTPISFDVTQDNSTKENALTIIKVNRPDLAQKGIIEITKTGEIFKSVGVLGGGYIDENGNDVEFPITYQPIYETGNLANAVFEIYAAEDITTLDGTIRYQQGEKVDEITTGKDGIAKSKELYLGKYTVIEKTAPNGFYNSGEQYDVELTYAGQEIKVTSTALSVYNERQKVNISLSKLLEQNETFAIGMNDEILSVQFGIFTNEDIKAADGSVIPADSLITYANCDENGNLTFNCDLPIGYKFYVKEIATDNHYILSDTKYEFDTEYQGQDIETINIDLNNGEPIKNDLIYGSVKGLKTDRETGKTIKGALFGLFKADETEYTENNAILTATTDENGIFIFNNIPFGNWIVKEIKPAENYLPSNDIHHITVSENEQIIELTVVNDMIPELKTTATVDGEKEVTAKGEITITDTVEYKHLIPGKEYVIKGILMNKATGTPFEIDGKPVTSEVTFTPEKSSDKIDIKFTFDSSVITETTELVVFETLYRDNVEIAVHADINDEGQTVTIKAPEKHKSPKTSDDSNVGILIAVAVVSTLGIGGTLYAMKHRKKKEDAE